MTKQQYLALYRLARLWTLHRNNRLTITENRAAIESCGAAWISDQEFNSAGYRIAELALPTQQPKDWLAVREHIYTFHAQLNWQTIPGDLYLQSRRAKYGLDSRMDY